MKQGVGVVIAGSIAPRGNGYEHLAQSNCRPLTGNTIVTSQGQASSKDQVLEVADQAGHGIRRALGDQTSRLSTAVCDEESVDNFSRCRHALRGPLRSVNPEGKDEDALHSYLERGATRSEFRSRVSGHVQRCRGISAGMQDAEKYMKEGAPPSPMA